MSETARQPHEQETPEESYRYLLERVNSMETRNLELREQLRQAESDKRYIETQKIRYEREVRKLKSEIEQLRSPPLVVGTITDVIDGNRVIVRSSAGPRFLVRELGLYRPGPAETGSAVHTQPAVPCGRGYPSRQAMMRRSTAWK